MSRSPPRASPRLTAIVLTFEDEVHIERCLERLAPLTPDILVVDSFSTDRTVEIATAAGARVLQNKFINHAAQYNWAIDQVGDSADWLLWIDSDEWLEAALIAEIRATLEALPVSTSALSIRRKVVFKGRWIQWGGYYDTVLTRLWRCGRARVEQRWMDPHLSVFEGSTMQLRGGDIVDENLKDLTSFTDKHNFYSTRQMIDFISLETDLGIPLSSPLDQLNSQSRLKRFLRNQVYARTPLLLRAALYFLHRFILRLGFLDGRQGLVFHTLQGFWNFFLVDAKIIEARHYIARHGRDAFIDHLVERHGIRLHPDDALERAP